MTSDQACLEELTSFGQLPGEKYLINLDYADFFRRRANRLEQRGFKLKERTSKHELYATEGDACYCYLPRDPGSDVAPFIAREVSVPEINQMVQDYESFSYKNNPSLKVPGISSLVGLALGLTLASETGMDTSQTIEVSAATTLLGGFIGIFIDHIKEKQILRKRARFCSMIDKTRNLGYSIALGKKDVMDYLAFIHNTREEEPSSLAVCDVYPFS